MAWQEWVSLLVQGGDFLSVVLGAVGWLGCGIGVVVSSGGGGLWGGPCRGRPLEVVLSKVAVRRCRM